MSNLSFWEILERKHMKFGNFKADTPSVNWIGKNHGQKYSSLMTIFLEAQNMIFLPKTSKAPKLQKWPQKPSRSSYLGVMSNLSFFVRGALKLLLQASVSHNDDLVMQAFNQEL